MGGCCCCSSRRAETDQTPVYFYCPQDLEEHEPMSPPLSASSAIPAGLLVDTNLDISTPDTYRAPPAPLPYDVGLTCSETLPGSLENSANKTDHMEPADSQPLGENDGALEKLDGKTKTDCALGSPKVIEDETSEAKKPFASAMDEEDVCPTCLEEYDEDNPRMITKCEHHFHLSCILEWMERSDTCPVCDQVMVIDHASNE